MILLEPLEDLFQCLEMPFVCVGVDQEVVNVDDHILQVAEDSFHESLKRGWAPQKSHGRGDPVKLTFPWNGESRQWLRFIIQLHLPESGGEVQG